MKKQDKPLDELQLLGYIKEAGNYALKFHKRGDIRGTVTMLKDITAKIEEVTALLERVN